MAKLTRQTLLCFGINAGGSDIGIFGSLAAADPTYSNVISTIQSLPAWSTGWVAETISTNRPALEDMNAFCYVTSYGLCYLYEMGIPEYDAGTTYYINSMCQSGGIIYQSLQDANINNTPVSSPAYWSTLNYVDLSTVQTVNGIKTFGAFPITPSSAPSTNYQVANKKYVDDQIAAVPAQVGFGAWVNKTSSYGAQQAATDGFVMAYCSANSGIANVLEGYTDASANPTTIRISEGTASASSLQNKGIMFPVRKGDYWKVILNQGSTGATMTAVYWIPLGS